MNSRIEKFDTSQIGKNVNTYYDYIQFIYNALGKQYKNEYVYKNTFINQLLIKNYGIKNTVAINEFRVGNSIADIVLFNGTSKAFEIKTELDSDKRLTGQLSDYNKIFKECYVVTHESLSEKYLNENRHIGIIEFIDSPKSPSMKEIREAKINKYIDSDTLIRAIRTQEYKNIIKQYYGNLPEMNSFNMFEICRKLMKKIPNKYL
ncbi:MAG: sce7726 family protein, partial [Bacteroidota bacterium]